MPQGRIILKSICQSKKLANLKTDGARLLYTWLIPNLDVNGCFSGDAKVIKGQIFTRLSHSKKTIEKYLQDLEGVGLIFRYEADGDLFLIVPDFEEKQPSLKPEKEGKPTIPTPTPEQFKSKSGVIPPISKVKESKEKESKDIIEISKIIKERFDKFWEQYPRKLYKKQTMPVFFEKIRDDRDWENLQVALTNYNKSKDVEDGTIMNAYNWLDSYEDWIDYREPKKKSSKLKVEDL